MAKKRTMSMATVALHYTSKPDHMIWGEPGTWKHICKVSDPNERWMKSTKAMEIPGAGCLVQVSTMQGDTVAEALCFVPGVKLLEHREEDKLMRHSLVAIQPTLPTEQLAPEQTS
jgi:hypothetical protein